MRKHPGRYTLRWIDIATGEWAVTNDVAGGAEDQAKSETSPAL